MKIEQRARNFAIKAHGDQMYGDEPYVVHLDAVATIVNFNIIAMAIAYLHDVVEDTPVMIQQIDAVFGRFIAECVALVTDEPGRNRRERKASTHAKLSDVDSAHTLALFVKTADRVANVEACVRKGNFSLLKMYRNEQEAFRKAVYRPGLCDYLWLRIEAALSQKL